MVGGGGVGAVTIFVRNNVSSMLLLSSVILNFKLFLVYQFLKTSQFWLSNSRYKTYIKLLQLFGLTLGFQKKLASSVGLAPDYKGTMLLYI